ncbi:class I SAM-dependent methyltransferase [Demequina aurantiaca]|uniref:class I SAM-dependent methyltransferase n=1 Tax=Demequina aurantiaca TaxID=676200 RepID=UPI003D3493B3
MSSAAQWNSRYAAASVWSGAVNATLAERASALEPGTALDVGCGEGGDAVWLASQGWRVRGVDFSGEALSRASAAADQAGVSGQCSWIQADLSVWTTNHAYDLVTCHFLHEEFAVRGRAWQSAAAAVAPGGMLLIVGHSPEEPAGVPGPPLDARFSEQQVVDALALSSRWQVDSRTEERLSASATRLDVVVTATRLDNE